MSGRTIRALAVLGALLVWLLVYAWLCWYRSPDPLAELRRWETEFSLSLEGHHD